MRERQGVPRKVSDTFGLGPDLTEIVDDVIARAKAAVEIGLPINGCSNPTAVLTRIRALRLQRRHVPTVRGEVA